MDLRRAFAVFIPGLLFAISAAAQLTGYEAKKPIMAGACPTCPWGAIAIITREAMKPAGYDVQVCYTCSGVNNPRIVSERRTTPPPREGALNLPPSTQGPVDFGVTNLLRLNYAYLGQHDYAKDKPHKNLRAIALVEHPQYLITAAKVETFITDLAQIKERKLPARILTDGSPVTSRLLESYGITEAALKEWGGEIVGRGTDERNSFDVIVFTGYLGNTPESNIWYEVSQKNDLRFLSLAPALLDSLAEEFKMEKAAIPLGYMRGVDRIIPTVVRSGHVIYGRDDMPESFAYALAKAIDTEKRRLIWSHIQLSYNPDTVWRTLSVPLHPGAARYYREKGYMR